MSHSLVSLSDLRALLEGVNQAYRAKTMDLVSEDMVEPTWDGKRYHAPCNNYVFDDRSYAAGEFLHDPDVAGSGSKQGRLLIDPDYSREIMEILRNYGISGRLGKPWAEADGSYSQYLRIEGMGRFVNRLAKEFPTQVERMLVEASDDVETGSTWETTLGKLKQKYIAITAFEMIPVVPMSDGLEGKIMRWTLDNLEGKKPGTVRVTVGFHYPKKVKIVADQVSEVEAEVAL